MMSDQDVHAVAVVVPFGVLRAAAPHLRRTANAGMEVFRKVVNVASLAGMMGNARPVAYAAGKAGVVAA